MKRPKQAPVSAEPVVKALEWFEHPNAFPYPIWSAQTPFGLFDIEEVSASDTPAYEVRWHGHLVGLVDGIREAKELAQSDYEKRLLAALASPPPPAQADDGKDAEIERLTRLNSDHCRSVNTLLLDGSRLEDRAIKAEALIRELVAALDRIAKGEIYIADPAFAASTSAVIWAKYALAKAKAQGYEP